MTRESVIRQTHAAVTIEALEAMANKGLVRRAQKDLERGEVGPFTLGDAGLRVDVSGRSVTLVEAGPAQARCTCPAPGVCQHILAACLKLMAEPAATPSGEAQAEWLALTEADLLSTYGLPVMRAASRLERGHPVQIERAGGVLTVRFTTLNAEVLALPGVGLGGIIVSGGKPGHQAEMAAAAVLAVRREAGIPWAPPQLEAAANAPVRADAVLQAASEVLEEGVAAGLARISPGWVERLEAVALSAQAASLHRLGLGLQRVATLADDWRQRRPQADSSQLFGEMAVVYALAHASPEFAGGAARESYFEVGNLSLTGVAAWPWRTPSGYEGLTVLFWDETNGEWNTWSEARPRAFAGGFSAVARLTQPGPWEGAASPASLAASRFRLMQAKRNRWGRLSSSAQSHAVVTGPSDLSALPCCRDWESVNVTPSPGLRDRDPRRAYRILAPATWERRAFDPIAQALVWRLRDDNGRALEMRLVFDELAKPAIERLEALGDHDLVGAHLLGRCVARTEGLHVHPLALLRDGASTPLFFHDSAPAPSGPRPPSPSADPEDIEFDDSVVPPSPSSQIVLRILSALEWLAESGCQAHLPDLARQLDDLVRLTAPIPRLSQSLAALAPRSGLPRRLLQTRWMIAVLQRSLT